MNRDALLCGLKLMRSAQFVLDHRFTRRNLSAYLDGELASPDRERVAQHLEECRDCDFTSRSLRRMLASMAFLRGCAPLRISANVRARLGDRSRANGSARERSQA